MQLPRLPVSVSMTNVNTLHFAFAHGMWSKVYVTVGRPSACLSHRLTTATAVGGFAAERPVDRRY